MATSHIPQHVLAGAALSTVTEAYQRVAWADAVNSLTALPGYDAATHEVGVYWYTDDGGNAACDVWLIPIDLAVNDMAGLDQCQELTEAIEAERHIIDSLRRSHLIGTPESLRDLADPDGNGVTVMRLPATAAVPARSEAVIAAVLAL